MGEVWLASEVRLGRTVALKLLPSDLTRDLLRVQRFEQEARARLRTP
jgi:serine/threonine protein kinase